MWMLTIFVPAIAIALVTVVTAMFVVSIKVAGKKQGTK